MSLYRQWFNGQQGQKTNLPQLELTCWLQVFPSQPSWMLRLWKLHPWSLPLFLCEEEIRLSHHFILMLGLLTCQRLILFISTLLSIMDYPSASTLAFLPLTALSHLRIMLLLIYFDLSLTRWLLMNLVLIAILDHSLKHKLQSSLALSKLLLCPSFLNPIYWMSFILSKITLFPILLHLVTLQSIILFPLMISHAPGAHLMSCVLKSFYCLQDLRAAFKMYLRPIKILELILLNSPEQWYACQRLTSPLTLMLHLVRLLDAELMAWLLMLVLTSSMQKALAHCQNGLMIIVFSEYSSLGLQSTTLVDLNSTTISLHKGDSTSLVAACGGRANPCLMANMKKLMKIVLSLSKTCPILPHIFLPALILPTISMMLMLYQMTLTFPGNTRRTSLSPLCFPLEVSYGILIHSQLHSYLRRRKKYVSLIKEWLANDIHVLSDVESLYGKLLYVCCVIPIGRAYFTNLEKFLTISHDCPFLPWCALRGTKFNLNWWLSQLLSNLAHPIPGPCAIFDLNAFSDTSSGTSVAIVIRNRWQAWWLLPGWKSSEHNIQWAKGVGGFKLLVWAIAMQDTYTNCFHVMLYQKQSL